MCGSLYSTFIKHLSNQYAFYNKRLQTLFQDQLDPDEMQNVPLIQSIVHNLASLFFKGICKALRD